MDCLIKHSCMFPQLFIVDAKLNDDMNVMKYVNDMDNTTEIHIARSTSLYQFN